VCGAHESKDLLDPFNEKQQAASNGDHKCRLDRGACKYGCIAALLDLTDLTCL